jgi:hypothetical protein
MFDGKVPHFERRERGKWRWKTGGRVGISERAEIRMSLHFFLTLSLTLTLSREREKE